jgi:hypothetical protein
MRNQIRRYALGLIFIALLAAVPAGAATSDESGGDFLSYLKCFVTQLLDVEEGKLTLPPG